MRRTARSPMITSLRAKVQLWCLSTATRRRRAPSLGSSKGGWEALSAVRRRSARPRRVRPRREESERLFASRAMPAPSRAVVDAARTRRGLLRRLGISGVMSRSRWRLIFRERVDSSLSWRAADRIRQIAAGSVPAQSRDEIHFPGKPRQHRGVLLCRRVLQTGLHRYSAVLPRRCRAHGRAGARGALGASVGAGLYRDEGAVAPRSSKSRSPCCMGGKSSWSTRYFTVRSPCRPCGAARSRSFPGLGIRRNGRRQTRLTLSTIEAFVEDTP